MAHKPDDDSQHAGAADDNAKNALSPQNVMGRLSAAFWKSVENSTTGKAPPTTEAPAMEATMASRKWRRNLFQAAQKNDVTTLRQLLQNKKEDINNTGGKGRTALHIAARANAHDAVQMLLENGADPLLRDKPDRGQGRTPLELAMGFSATESAVTLIEHGGYTSDIKNEMGWSVQHVAAEKGQAKVLKALSAIGVDMDARLPDGTTPLLLAVRYHRVGAAQALLDDRQAVLSLNTAFSTKDGHRRTAFQTAVARGLTEVVGKMLDVGALPAQPDVKGIVPLEIALHQGHVAMVDMLVRRGADVNVINAQGESMLSLAQRQQASHEEGKGYAENVRLLEKAGAAPQLGKQVSVMPRAPKGPRR
ncbi:MAG: ankyrin repeat domain-containing protein [Alphaproteobacteria bacterium]|nr:ankyrin repeat domain-containing protein [Alphaproteobacteria bacterium]